MEIATITGMVMTENKVLTDTSAADKGTSLLNFCANMVVTAAEGEATAIAQAVGIVPRIPIRYIHPIIRAGEIISLNIIEITDALSVSFNDAFARW